MRIDLRRERIPETLSGSSAIVLTIGPEHLPLVQNLRAQYPLLVFVLSLEELQISEAIQALENQIEFLVTESENASLDQIYKKANQLALERWRSEGFLKSSSKQFREISRHQEDLEKQVEEKALHLRAAEVEEEARVRRVRQLIRWIRELSVAASIEDVLHLLKSELRPLHAISDCYLLVGLDPSRRFFYRLSRGQLHAMNVEKYAFAQAPKEPVLPAEASQFVADLCQRPVGKLLGVPLEVPLIRRLGFPEAFAQLIVESSLGPRESKIFFQEQGERLKSLSITVDRILLEDELTRYSYRWEKTFDGLAEPLSIIDRDFQVVRSNLSFSDRSRKGTCHLLFQNAEDRCPGCPVPKVDSSGKAARGEIKKGSRIFEVHSFPIFLGRRETVSNYVNLYVDVTNKRELTQKFIQTEKMSALGLLAGHIAHELNNPLTGLRSMAQLLARECAEDSQLKLDLGEIEKAAARSEQVIRHLLEFADLEGKHQEWTNVDEIVQRTLPLLKMTVRNHRLQLNLGAGDSEVYVQTHLLQQVIFNLITNACQAMPKSGELRVETKLSSNGQNVELRVIDSGPGIPVEIQKKVFEPFFTTKAEGEGTGLGLSLSRDIIQRFGGEIQLTSQMGVGSEFCISLPARRSSP